MTNPARISERFERVRAEIAAAARRAGRDPEEIRLVAASKYADVESIREVAQAGQRDFAENYLQPAIAKMQALADLDLRWHFIGALQSNKAARAARSFHLLHTLGSEAALTEIAKAMKSDGASCRVLIQVKLGDAPGRPGVDASSVADFVRAAGRCGGILVDGVMGLPPAGEPSRPHFARLRSVLEELRAMRLESAPLREMSAGMSEDFEDAICEGSTIVRIGRALFGESSG